MKKNIILLFISIIMLTGCASNSASWQYLNTPSSTNSYLASSNIQSSYLMYPQQAAVDMINEILLRYETGEYPADFFYYGDLHSEHIPDGISLPEEITFDDLHNFDSLYEGGNNKWGNDYTVNTMIYLDDNYGMDFHLLVPPQGVSILDYLVADTFHNYVVDLLGKTRIEELEGSITGTFQNIEFDRVRIYADVLDVSLPELDMVITGHIRWERVNNHLIFSSNSIDVVDNALRFLPALLDGFTVTKINYFDSYDINNLSEAEKERHKVIIQTLVDEFIKTLNNAGYSLP